MKAKIFRVVFFVWALLLFTLTSYPKLSISSHSIIGLDKLAHFIMYLLFALFFMLMRSEKSHKPQLRNLISLSIIVPLIDELHQIPIPGRSFSFYDVLADILGFAVIYSFYRYIKKI